MADAPEVSIVVPVFNGASFIERSLQQITATLRTLGGSWEVLVVCDGSTDGTAEAAEAADVEGVRVLRYSRNQGKGFALVIGLANARGRFVGWFDADLDIHPDVLVRAMAVFNGSPEVDAVIGSKRHPGSSVDYPAIRRVYSFGYQLIVRCLFRLDVRDTQVGAKLVRREMLDVVLPLLLIKRYAFDLEMLAVGTAFGFDRVREVPVSLDYRFTGTGIDWRAVRRMFIDTLAIAYRLHLRHWYVRRYAALQRGRAYEGLGRAAPQVPEMPGAMAALEELGVA